MSADFFNRRIPVHEMPERAQPTLPTVDRERLADRHQAIYARFYGEFEQFREPLDPPICGECGEPWGLWGCPTRRALAVLALAEHQRDAAKKHLAEVIPALAKAGARGGFERMRETGQRTMEVRVQVVDFALLSGRMQVVEYTLADIARKFRRWFTEQDEANRDPMVKAVEIFADAERAARRATPTGPADA